MLKKWLCMTVNTDKSYFWGWALVCVLRSTRELEKLSQGLTMKDLIVTPSQPDKHWPIYSEPTLLSNGSSAFLVSSHLLSPLSPFFPPPFPSWFSHDSLTAFCTIAVFLTSILAPYSLWSSSWVTHFWSSLLYYWPIVCVCVMVAISRYIFIIRMWKYAT